MSPRFHCICGPNQLLEARNPAVIFSNGVGDHLLNLPALRALAHVFRRRLTLICSIGKWKTFFRELPLRSVCEADMHISGNGRIFDAESVARAVEPCDLLISLNPWHSISVDRLLGALKLALSVGFCSSFHVKLDLDYAKHSADLAFDMPRFFAPSLTLDDFAAPPKFLSIHKDQAQRIRNVFPADYRTMVVHADTGCDKMWAPDRFASVLRTFLRRHPNFLVFVVGSRDLNLDSGDEDCPIISCCGLSIPTTICLVAEADLFLGVDSSMLHAADLFRVPVVGLFGPTDCKEWGFRFGHGKHVCGEGFMDSISESQVIDAIDSLLADIGASPKYPC